MLYPTDLKYSKSHEWVKMEDGVAVIGISDFAQDALGDVVFVNLPGEGDDRQNDACSGEDVSSSCERHKKEGEADKARLKNHVAQGYPASCS